MNLFLSVGNDLETRPEDPIDHQRRRRRSRKVNITIGEKKEAREKGQELQVLQAPALGALRNSGVTRWLWWFP